MMRVRSVNIKYFRDTFVEEQKSFAGKNISIVIRATAIMLKNNNRIIGEMISDILEQYKKIGDGYTNIVEYLNSYIEDFDSLERSLATGSNNCSNANASTKLMGLEILPNIEPIKDFLTYHDTAAIEDESDKVITNLFDDKTKGEKATYVDENDVKKVMEKYPFMTYEWCLYYTILEKYHLFPATYSEEERKNLVSNIENYDKTQFNRQIIHSFPVVCHGMTDIIIGETVYNGDYLKYYNENGQEVVAPLATLVGTKKGDPVSYTAFTEEQAEEYIKYMNKYYKDYMKCYNNYPEYYKDKLNNSVNKVVFIQLPDASNTSFEGAGAMCYFGQDSSSVVFRTDQFYNVEKGSYSDESYKHLVTDFDHELGHSFNATTYNNNSEEFFDNTDAWLTIYEQVNQSDPNHELISKYGHSKPREMFAEAMAEYYGTSEKDLDYSPEDLKNIEIDYDGYTNLYDLIDDVANGKYPKRNLWK